MMKRRAVAGTLMLFVGLTCVSEAVAQGRGRGGGRGAAAAPAQQARAEPAYLMGCVSGGDLQPVEEPFVLEPAEPFVLTEVITQTESSVFAPTDYRITGMNFTPWRGMRVRVEGAVVQPRPGASGVEALPEFRATRVSSIWGTCPSPAAWKALPRS